MSDFKLLLKRRHLLAQTDRCVKEEESEVNQALQVEKCAKEGTPSSSGNTHDTSIGDCGQDINIIDNRDHDSKQGFCESETDINAHQDTTFTDCGVSLISSTADKCQQHCPPSPQHNSSVNNNKPAKRLEKKDLIFSAGTVRSRYRDVRKEEESRVQKKHYRTMKKHSQALIHESLGTDSKQGRGTFKQKKNCGSGSKSKIVDNSSSSADESRAHEIKAGTAERLDQRKVNAYGPTKGINGDKGRDAVRLNQTVLDDPEHPLLPSAPASPRSSLPLSSVIREETADESIEELMYRYYEHEDSQGCSGEEEGIGAQTPVDQREEIVVLTESVPFTEYPANLCIIDGLQYSKFCTDPIYKGDILIVAKSALQQRQHLLLRSPLHFCTVSGALPSGDNPNSKYSINSGDTRSDDQVIHECKQVLKSIFMSCVSFCEELIPPLITERTTIQREVLRRKTTPLPSKKEDILHGKSISEFVEMEMLIAPKPQKVH